MAARVYSISPPQETADPEYLDGLRSSLTAALDYALAAIERGGERAPSPPPALLVQARMAARHRVGLDTVLRRYFAGYSLLSELVIAEAEEGGLFEEGGLRGLLRGQAAFFGRLISAVSEEHAREGSGQRATSEQRRAERVRRLLAGELHDASELAYDFDRHHLGLIASGAAMPKALGALAERLDARLLLVQPEEHLSWAWLGGRHPLDPEEVGRLLASRKRSRLALALGEPGEGLEGWRLTHRQAAAAALPIATCGPKRFVRYADVALLAAALQDDLLATSLRRIYLAPLDRERDGGATLRATLAAYFRAAGNASSAAAGLGVSRKTVSVRLRAVEEKIGSPLSRSARELETALELHRLQSGPAPPPWR